MDHETHRDQRRYPPKVGCRHILTIMGFLGYMNVYAMRVNLSVAIVSMVNHSAIHSDNKVSSSSCGITNSSSNHNNQEDGTFPWDEATQGKILGAFFYGYVITQVPGGRLSEMFGGKWLFGGGVLVTAVFTLLTPLAAKSGLVFLYAVRIIEGLGEGVTFPAMTVMISRWSPPWERSRMLSFSQAGCSFGTFISLPVSGIICEYLGWEAVFYLFGAISLVWFVGWCFLVYDSPEKHPRISETEKAYIVSSLIDSENSKPNKIPWSSMLTSVPFWAIACAHITQNFGFYVLLTELPSYLNDILNFNFKQNASVSWVPYFLMWFVSLVAPMIADYIIIKKIATKDAVRKFANTIATMIPALALIGAGFSGCITSLTLVLLCLAVGANGATYTGEQAAMIDISNNFAGTIMGIINALGNIMGFVAPLVTGIFINHHNDIPHWQYVFFLASGLYLIGNTTFLYFGTTKEQPWNRDTGRSEIAQEVYEQ